MRQMHVILNIFICDTKYIHLCLDREQVQHQCHLIYQRVFSWFVNPALRLFFESHVTDSKGILKVGTFRASELILIRSQRERERERRPLLSGVSTEYRTEGGCNLPTT